MSSAEITGNYLLENEYLIQADYVLDKAVAAFEGAATRFSIDAISDANVRNSYQQNIKRVVSEVKEMVDTKKISVKEASIFCYEMRNKIMAEHRKITSPQGLGVAERHKRKPPSLDDLLNKYAQQKFSTDMKNLTINQKNSIYYEIIESAARDNQKFTTMNKRLNILGKVGIVITATIATYEILDAENKPKEAIKQGMTVGGGVLGGWLAGFAVTPLCGPGAPVCAIAVVLLGGTAGGIAGSVAADSLDDEIEEFTKWAIH
ncbi:MULTISPECIES: hypothetical protein [Providencia]|uniref:hypothetical protein n=1 Tax=Providencia TaxID=586 RepID=UPI0012B61189|nr:MULTISPECIES: hypothetical protein [Providencia]MTC31033.1 hypothetical protein [Providencia alcalifaciens]